MNWFIIFVLLFYFLKKKKLYFNSLKAFILGFSTIIIGVTVISFASKPILTAKFLILHLLG
jgi:hypothetical protein